MSCTPHHINVFSSKAYNATTILTIFNNKNMTKSSRVLEHNTLHTKTLPYHLVKRHSLVANVTPSSQYYNNSSKSLDKELPLLPFPLDQIVGYGYDNTDKFKNYGYDTVFVPTESKTLHLYEARYLALLDESLLGRNKYFVHFVLDPIRTKDTSEASFAARYACLVVIEKVERLDVGALVSIRGIGRVKIVNFVQAEPYIRGIVNPMQDVVLDSTPKLNAQIAELKEVLQCLTGLEIKLKAPKEALLQTRITNSLQWAEKDHSLDNYEAFLPQLAERLSFAALQPVSGLTQSESLKLQKEKLTAMNGEDTVERLTQALEYVKENISMVAAKLAIQSLDA